jgi:D-alanyl-D-alanine carboxypeptidase
MPSPPPAIHSPYLFARAQAAELPRVQPASTLMPLAAPGSAPSGWGVQVGAFPDPSQSHAAVQAARTVMAGALAGTASVIMPVPHEGRTLYRARLMGLSPQAAMTACGELTRRGFACFTVPPGNS